MFQHTHDPKYLATARQMANYFVQNIPSDGVVPWYVRPPHCHTYQFLFFFFFFFFLHRDFNAPSPPADTSAATIAATGLLLLSEMEMSLSPVNTTGRDLWRAEAIQVRRASSAISKHHDPHPGVCLDSSRHDGISMAACMAEFTVEWHC